MKTDRELMQQALEALKLIDEAMPFPVAKLTIKNLRERLAQPEQEPVAWGVFEGNLHDMFFTQEEAQEMARLKGSHAEVRPFYATPPQRTEPPQKKVWTFWDLSGGDITDAIKAKLKEKNT